jgi:hypothetical protein
MPLEANLLDARLLLLARDEVVDLILGKSCG